MTILPSTYSSVYRFRTPVVCLALLLLWVSALTVWRLLDGYHMQQLKPPNLSPVTLTRNTKTNASLSISAFDMGISREEWDRLQKALYWPSPDHEITELGLSTSPVYTTFSILGFNDTYKVGDKIRVIITARDHNKNLKTHGGDFFQVKLFNITLKASIFGEVIDHCNGTYTVDLLLPWEGQAQVSVRLAHSSEVVWILKKHRDTSFPRSHYNGYFEGPGPNGFRISEKVECNIKWGSDRSWSKGNCCCEFKNLKTGTVWQCDRPKQLSCDHWVYHERGPLESPLNALENLTFTKELTNVNISGDKHIINVLPNTAGIGETEKCRSGLITPVPAGFYYKDVWKSFVCNTQVFTTPQMTDCLSNKIVYLLGDSTLRQWFEYLEIKVPGIQRVNLHTPRGGGPLMAIELKKNISVHWKAHSFPIQFSKVLKTNLFYISNAIDEITGGSHAVVVLTYFAHQVFHPLTYYVHEVAKIRQAVVALVRRAPDTTVIIKSGNTAAFKDIFQSDWFVLQFNTVMREMFRDIDGVIYMDVWQMTSCHYLTENIHPEPVIIYNELNMLLSYICPA